MAGKIEIVFGKFKWGGYINNPPQRGRERRENIKYHRVIYILCGRFAFPAPLRAKNQT